RGVYSQAILVCRDWEQLAQDAKRIENQRRVADKLSSDAQSFNETLSSLYETLYGDKGVMRKTYPSYPDEIQFFLERGGVFKVRSMTTATKGMLDALGAVTNALGHNDPDLV